LSAEEPGDTPENLLENPGFVDGLANWSIPPDTVDISVLDEGERKVLYINVPALQTTRLRPPHRPGTVCTRAST
jgi:hypothetical protein